MLLFSAEIRTSISQTHFLDANGQHHRHGRICWGKLNHASSHRIRRKHYPPFPKGSNPIPCFLPTVTAFHFSHFAHVRYDPAALDLQYRRFVESAGCPWEGSLECLQKRSPRVLQRANQHETARAEWGKFTFGPAVDGSYVRDLPGRELLRGNHVKNIGILQGHNECPPLRWKARANCREEGLIFVDPALMVATDRDTRIAMRKNMPLASIETLRKVRDMYPRPSASQGEYAHQFDRVNALIEGNILCNPRPDHRLDFQL